MYYALYNNIPGYWAPMERTRLDENCSRRLACGSRGGGRKRSGPLFSPTFFFFYAFCFSPTLGNLPCVKICFPQYFGIPRRYMQKKKKFEEHFIFLRKKGDFSTVFCFLRPAFGHGRLGHPQSLEYWNC